MVRYVKNILSDFRSFCLAISKMIYLEILWRNHRENSKHVFWTHSNGAIDYQWGDRKSAEDRKLKTIDSCWEIWLDSWKKNLSEINYILKRKSIPNHFVIHVFCIFFLMKISACLHTYLFQYVHMMIEYQLPIYKSLRRVGKEENNSISRSIVLYLSLFGVRQIFYSTSRIYCLQLFLDRHVVPHFFAT